jgi:hypothetical protein
MDAMQTSSDELVMPSGFRRVDLVRLITQCLSTLGYAQTAEMLEKESGVRLLSEPIERFRAAVLAGDWALAEGQLDRLGFTSLATKLSAQFLILRQKYMELLEAGRTEEALLCLRGQLAPLEQQRSDLSATAATASPSPPPAAAAAAAAAAATSATAPTAAAETVASADDVSRSTRSSPVPPPVPTPPCGTLRELSSFLMIAPAQLHVLAGWDGSAGRSRECLLAELDRLIPPSLLLPEHRLQRLLEQGATSSPPATQPCQTTSLATLKSHATPAPASRPPPLLLLLSAVLWQSSRGIADHPAHLGGTPFSTHTFGRALLEDFAISRANVPTRTQQVFEVHTDEVWFVEFSHRGDRLASAARDGLVVLWDIPVLGVGSAATPPAPAVSRSLTGHKGPLSCVAWSHDDTRLLTGGDNEHIKLWDTGSGECLRTFTPPNGAATAHAEAVSCLAWLHGDSAFVSASTDKTLALWSAEGERLQALRHPGSTISPSVPTASFLSPQPERGSTFASW